jgi:hypothetical protein
VVTPGPPALCEGSVVHRRSETSAHTFTYPVSQVWLDPDDPEALCSKHWAWSASRPAPARFRRSDYGAEPTDAALSLGEEVRLEVSAVLGRSVDGPVRMLTQVRRWGWLFNPITIFLLWEDPTAQPVGAVLEVTNTPWKERHRYPIVLEPHGSDLLATFDKQLHVSPFLGMQYRYDLRIADRDDRVAIDIDVVDPEGAVAVHTALRTRRLPASKQNLATSLRTTPPPTHRVSAGIHVQAARLWRKGVAFVPHPNRTSPEVST